MSNRHTYLIDRDEREIGGKLVTVAAANTWLAIKRKWDDLPPDPRKDVTLFLGRVEPNTGSITTMDCK